MYFAILHFAYRSQLVAVASALWKNCGHFVECTVTGVRLSCLFFWYSNAFNSVSVTFVEYLTGSPMVTLLVFNFQTKTI